MHDSLSSKTATRNNPLNLIKFKENLNLLRDFGDSLVGLPAVKLGKLLNMLIFLVNYVPIDERWLKAV